MDHPPITGYFVCRECSCQLPRSEESTMVRGVCFKCFSINRVRKKKEDKKNTIVQSRLKQLISAARGQKIHAPHVSEICEGMIKQFGGVGAFCTEWKYQIDRAIDQRPGSKVVLDHFYTLFKMVATSTENRDTAPDIAGLSDEQLAAEMISFLEEVEPKIFNPDEDDVEDAEFEYVDHIDSDEDGDDNARAAGA